MFKIGKGIKEKIKEKEYLKEYVKFCSIANLEKIKGKEIYIMYDEILPDLFVSIDVNNMFIDSIDYDIYADRLKRVKLEFPNGDIIYKDIVNVKEEERQDNFYCLTWQVPMISMKWHGVDIEISIIDLLEKEEVKIFIDDYSFDFEKK